ncbi:MAG: hypothetical protein HW401_370 [Parcubacteria group bacterium]|nr:hypothetical protein [Parcubacteria group bacterium]
MFFFSLLFAVAPSIVKADSVNVTGYAWSSNIGWIKFDTGKSNSVKYDMATGNLSGYAWSSNIGWIKFDGLSASGGVGGSGAKADSPSSITSSTVSGWARACAGTQSGDCTSMTSRTDGWDGWIKMSDSSWVNGVSINLTSSSAKYGEFTGYAWGSEVVGWISFNCSNTNTCGTSDYKVKANLPGTPIDVTCSPSSSTVTLGSNVTFTANPSGGITPYTYTWSDSVEGSNSSVTTLYSTLGKKYATIKVTDSSSPIKSDSYTCSVDVVVGGFDCGNSLLESGETCDDGNTNSGDGCSSSCQTESSSSSSSSSGATGPYDLTVNITGSGSGSVYNVNEPDSTSGGKTWYDYAQDTKVKLQVTPNSGSIFTGGWVTSSGGNCANGAVSTRDIADDTCEFTMDGDKTTTVDFGLTSGVTTYDCVSNTNTCQSVSGNGGEHTTLSGCTSVCGGGGGTIGPILELKVGCGTVTVDEDGFTCGIGPSCFKSYLTDTILTLTATETGGSDFSSWSGGGCGSINPCSVTMDESKTVQAIFDPDTCDTTSLPPPPEEPLPSSSSSSSKPSVIIHEI